MSKKQFSIIKKPEPFGESVTNEGIPCTARYCAARLNELSGENEWLKEENYYLKEFVLHIVAVFENGNNALSKTRFKLICDATNMDKTYLKECFE